MHQGVGAQRAEAKGVVRQAGSRVPVHLQRSERRVDPEGAQVFEQTGAQRNLSVLILS